MFDDGEKLARKEQIAEIRHVFITVLQEFTMLDPDSLSDEEIDSLSLSEDIGLHNREDIENLVELLKKGNVPLDNVSGATSDVADMFIEQDIIKRIILKIVG